MQTKKKWAFVVTAIRKDSDNLEAQQTIGFVEAANKADAESKAVRILNKIFPADDWPGRMHIVACVDRPSVTVERVEIDTSEFGGEFDL